MRKQRGSAWHYHILKFINELGLNTKLASLKGEGKEKYQFDFPKTVGELICMQILDSVSKRHMFFTLSDSKETTMDGISLHHVYRALDILCRHSTEINTYSCKSAKKIIEKDSSKNFYDCTNLVYPRGCDGEFLGMKKSKERIFAPLVQMGLLIDENGFPVGMNIFKGNRSKQLRLKEQIRQISTVIPTQKSMLSKKFAGLSFPSPKRHSSQSQTREAGMNQPRSNLAIQ